MSIIALISDFGTKDWFVSELKARLLSIAPQTSIVDITHEISPGDLRAAAFIISIVYRQFPSGTIFCLNVDPAICSHCQIIIAQSAEYTFISPDNGVLSLVFSETQLSTIHACSNPAISINSHSTFRGRDIIAPVAAHCANGTHPRFFGPSIENLVTIPLPEVSVNNNYLTAEVLYIDHFGNIITAVKNQLISSQLHKMVIVDINGCSSKMTVAPDYNGGIADTPLVYQGANGFVEIALIGNSAAVLFNVKIGDRISIQFE
ncbi:MAG TPA: SAM-dependent chlorinase/fluorinase [Chitinispirillaceae bacterium]|nr:SAM-dependent chlorinase/fluorinase [Chitinispirillaceae bacterium]